MIDLFKLAGIIGLLAISVGIITKKRNLQDIYYIVGGMLLEVYSLSIGDLIFIVLQIIFVAAAVYDFVKLKLGKKKA
ncbi:MAG: hypothetical protein WC304_01030 [Candidatus Gracilibacteria bacterium]|jgi:lipid-A-disaccharide synthase-like uncharacterized protein